MRWKTLSTYRSQVRLHVIPILGAARLSELRPETLEELYRRLLDAGSSAHVVQAVHRVLRSALNEAVRRQRLAVNPALIARPPRVAVVEVQPLTADECRAILRTAAAGPDAARWSVALALGLRQGGAQVPRSEEARAGASRHDGSRTSANVGRLKGASAPILGVQT